LESTHGVEWIVEAHGCSPRTLSELPLLKRLFSQVINDLRLHPVGEIQWHQFPGSGGITGLCLLSESHLACHTFPEHGSLCLNLFCCRQREEWPFRRKLTELFGAESVAVRRIERPYAPQQVPAPQPDLVERASAGGQT
jgi:S-adenosylmethionine decarboxylase